MSTDAARFAPEPDLHPLYPEPQYVQQLLMDPGLSPQQKQILVEHSLLRACAFADLPLLTFLLSDSQPRPYIDLDLRDEDGLSLVSVTIVGFGTVTDRHMEREECVRSLIQEGADLSSADYAGWTALHYAAVSAPPPLVAHLISHGCSPLAQSRRNLTPLDVITAYEPIEARASVALLLAESMRNLGWKGVNKRDEARKRAEARHARLVERRQMKQRIGHVLELEERWWGKHDPADSEDTPTEIGDDDESGYDSDTLPTPPQSYRNMLVFSPPELPHIFQSIITDMQPSIRHGEPAKILYLHARFACVACDHNWLEDLVVGSMDKIEDVVMSKPTDVASLSYWLFNTTLLLHLLRCDNDTNQICEILGLFGLIEELLNVIYVLIIRIVERRIDPFLDPALLDHLPLPTEFEAVQYESEWSILRAFTSPKKKALSAPVSTLTPSGSLDSLRVLTSPTAARPTTPTPTRPTSPSPKGPIQQLGPPNAASRFSALRFSISKSMANGNADLLQGPAEVTGLLSALHVLMGMFGINPVLITQTFSQVFYWTACELFNRILQRKKYLCRARAVQISLNLSVIEEWVLGVGLPRGVAVHFQPVRELLTWLQHLSSIDQFTDLVATVQTFKHLNPSQMRRAVRDYRYEVGENRMTEECSQYLAQLQKDWERQRVRLGVEALRKSIADRGESDSDSNDETSANQAAQAAQATSEPDSSEAAAQKSIDNLFSRTFDKSEWAPPKPPAVLGELLDSRHMLPLLLPSDPIHLGGLPVLPKEKHLDRDISKAENSRPSSVNSNRSRGCMEWSSRSRRLRVVGTEILDLMGEPFHPGGRWKWSTSILELGDEADVESKGGSQVAYPEANEVTEVGAGERAKSPKLTLNPPRMNKAQRRMTGGDNQSAYFGTREQVAS